MLSCCVATPLLPNGAGDDPIAMLVEAAEKRDVECGDAPMYEPPTFPAAAADRMEVPFDVKAGLLDTTLVCTITFCTAGETD